MGVARQRVSDCIAIVVTSRVLPGYPAGTVHGSMPEHRCSIAADAQLPFYIEPSTITV
jgi:hypothetical protein